MSSRLGIRLFTGSTLERYFRRLPIDAYEECRYLFEHVVGNDGQELIAELRKSFSLEPVHLTTVTDVSADAHATGEMAGEGKRRGFLVSARVPFRGSRQFLRTSIAPDFRPRFRGRITRTAVHLLTVLPSLDLSAFRDEAVAEVRAG